MKKGLELVLKNNKPHGIRNEGGFLLLFPEIKKFSGQDTRYREELLEQFNIADILLMALKQVVGEE